MPRTDTAAATTTAMMIGTTIVPHTDPTKYPILDGIRRIGHARIRARDSSSFAHEGRCGQDGGSCSGRG